MGLLHQTNPPRALRRTKNNQPSGRLAPRPSHSLVLTSNRLTMKLNRILFDFLRYSNHLHRLRHGANKDIVELQTQVTQLQQQMTIDTSFDERMGIMSNRPSHRSGRHQQVTTAFNGLQRPSITARILPARAKNSASGHIQSLKRHMDELKDA